MSRVTFSFLFLIIINISTDAQQAWSLQQCIDYALSHNISIKQSNLDNNLAIIDKSSAVGSFLPTINADASHSWNIGLNQNIQSISTNFGKKRDEIKQKNLKNQISSENLNRSNIVNM